MDVNKESTEISCKCRICFKSESEMRHLLSEVVHKGETIVCKELVKHLANLEIVIIGNVPMSICIDCYRQLLEAYSFVTTIKNSEKYWCSQIGEALKDPLDCDIKTEPSDQTGEFQYEDNSELRQSSQSLLSELPSTKTCIANNIKHENLAVLDAECEKSDALEHINDVTAKTTTLKSNADTEENANVNVFSFSNAFEMEMDVQSLHANTNIDTVMYDAPTESDSDSSEYWAPHWYENTRKNTKIVKKEPAPQDNGCRPFECEHCFKRYRRNSDLKWHLRLVHKLILKEEADSFPCSHCPRLFLKENYLKSHVRLYHRDVAQPNIDYAKVYGRHLCQYCGQMIRHIVAHVRRHENCKPHKCHCCDISFFDKATLTEHQRIHTGEKPFKCEVCAKCFRTRTSKITHMLTHTKEKTFKCQLCEKVFAQPAGLKNHINTQHNGEQQLNCNICNELFNNKASLQLHHKIYHNFDANQLKYFGEQTNMLNAEEEHSESNT